MSLCSQLREYYNSQGISALNFLCQHKDKCSTASGQPNPYFTGPKEALVGTNYEKATLPRVLFVSLDSGGESPDPHTRMMEHLRNWEENDLVVADLPKNKHWYLTHLLAWHILKKFRGDLTLETLRSCFAHTNSAKCCENNSGSAEASNTLFNNCRQYLHREVEILDPRILITQGNQAKAAIDHQFQEVSDNEILEGSKNPVLLKINDRPVLWIHTYHPSYYGGFWKQKDESWDGWADLAFRFIQRTAI